MGPIGISGRGSLFIGPPQYRTSRRVNQVLDGSLQRGHVITQVAQYVTVAGLAQQAPYLAGLVVVVDGQAPPAGTFRAPADVANAALCLVDGVVLFGGYAIGLFDPSGVSRPPT
jgi:hypothetical protein